MLLATINPRIFDMLIVFSMDLLQVFLQIHTFFKYENYMVHNDRSEQRIFSSFYSYPKNDFFYILFVL